MKNLRQIAVFLLVTVVFSSCAAAKIDKNLPEWAKNRVSDPNYFVGIGYAQKVKKSTVHYEQAAKAALNDLATEISVNISASTLLVTIVDDKQAADELSSVVQARVKQDIEGYEKVASYENKQGYWVYYRLSKAKYAAAQEAKRQLATQKSKNFVVAAQLAENQNDIKLAVINYAKALDAIKAYLNDEIVAEIDGKSLKIIPFAHTKIYDLLRNIQLFTNVEKISCCVGDTLSGKTLTCRAFLHEKPIANFPIAADYSERVLSRPSQLTSSHGEAQFAINGVRSRKNVETITFSIDKNAILLESAVDFSIRRWLSGTPTASKSVEILVKKPSIFIVSNEKNLDFVQKQGSLQAAFRTFFQKDGFTLAPTAKNADFVLKIEANTSLRSSANGMFTALLNGKVSLQKKANSLYVKSLTDIKGTQLSPEKAGDEAYKAAAHQVEIRLYQEILRAIYNK